jgi:hypothetical protein
MGRAPALRVAIDLMHMPSRVRLVRSDPLPDGVLMLLQIAAGDKEAETDAAELTGRSHDVVREAAAFFIEQILLGPDTDSYRRLGASPQATSSELRRNMALLLKWLHPDLDRQGVRSLFARRVTGAWNDLKTPERRAAYDEARRSLHAKKSLLNNEQGARPAPCGKQAFKQRLNNSGPYERWGKSGRSLDICKIERTGFLLRALFFLFGGTRR